MTAPLRRLLEAYVADPVLIRSDRETLLLGTAPGSPDARAFGLHRATDGADGLGGWTDLGGALERLPESAGTDYWAPEVAEIDGRWWMYYSVGHGDAGHLIRVAVADAPSGPYRDTGTVLTPDERFAIDAHPFRDEDGTWYLFFARDVLDHERPGTHLAVVQLASPTETFGEVRSVLAPDADWQIYLRDREMYGARYDWHTLEGPSVVRRHGRYWMTFSGGAWTGPGYAVTWAVADHPLGPWTAAGPSAAPLLATGTPAGAIGPGHNSLSTDGAGGDLIVFHSWDETRTRREPWAAGIDFRPDGPVLDSVDS